MIPYANQHEIRAMVVLRPCPQLTWHEGFRLHQEIASATGRVEILQYMLDEISTSPDADRVVGIRLAVDELKIVWQELGEILAIAHGERDPRKLAAENSEAAQ